MQGFFLRPSTVFRALPPTIAGEKTKVRRRRWHRRVSTVLASSTSDSPPTLEVPADSLWPVKIRSFPHKKIAPVRFILQNIQENKKIATVRYSDRSWTVMLRSYGRDRGAFFSAGWPAFARETRRHVEDVCVFTLIDRVVCRVYIFTSAGNTNEKIW